MHIRFETSLAGHNFAYAPGDVVDWPNDAEAQRFVERGAAEELTPAAATAAASSSGRPVRKHRAETATRRAPETAATR